MWCDGHPRTVNGGGSVDRVSTKEEHGRIVSKSEGQEVMFSRLRPAPSTYISNNRET